MKLGFRLIAGFFALAAAMVFAEPAFAVSDTGAYKGSIMTPASAFNLTMKPGETKSVLVSVKNTGTATWRETDKAYPIIYTYFPKYRKSVFRSASWNDVDSPTRLRGVTVKPNLTTAFIIDLTAPSKEGSYEEGFWLAAFDKTWIPGTQFKFKITVANGIARGQSPSASGTVPVVAPVAVPAAAKTPTVVAQDAPAMGTGSDDLAPSLYKASLISKSDKIVGEGGREVSYRIIFKNTSDVKWSGYAVRTASIVQIASSSTLAMADARASSWPTAGIALVQHYDTVQPGNNLILDVPFRTPQKKGEYQLAFNLNVDGSDVDGGMIDIPVSVTNDANEPPPPVPVQTTPYTPPSSALVEPTEAQPNLRVGLYDTPNGETVMGNMQFSVTDTSGRTYFNQNANTTVTLNYENGKYKAFSDQGLIAISDLPLRLTGVGGEAIFTVVSHPNPVSWSKVINDNKFRGVLEIRYAPIYGSAWLINEIPIEEYLKGLIEAGESTTYPAAYQQALAVAARTYAYYHYTTKTKHKDGQFDVDASYDQVYRGYGAESRQPRTAASVDATRGMIARYQGGLALTPYYTHSDGNTRSYKEVWGRNVPYLIAVPAPYDAGKTMLGHGVGMSALDAVGHAKYENWDWQRIIKYYYTGVDVVQRW
ncbi:MAG: SpoIID/LytB domain-containing protein [bacterium]